MCIDSTLSIHNSHKYDVIRQIYSYPHLLALTPSVRCLSSLDMMHYICNIMAQL